MYRLSCSSVMSSVFCFAPVGMETVNESPGHNLRLLPKDAMRRSGHARVEGRSLAMHRVIAEKLRNNPGLLEAAGENIRRWRRQGVDVTAFAEWEAILGRGVAETVRVLTDPSEEGTRLRQSTPFTGVLTPAERRRFYEARRS